MRVRHALNALCKERSGAFETPDYAHRGVPLVASTATLPSTDVDNMVLMLIHTEISECLRVLVKLHLLSQISVLKLDPVLCLFLGIEHDEPTHGCGVKVKL